MTRVASVPILVLLGISVLDFKAQCTQQTDVRRVSSLIAPISLFLGFSVLVPMYDSPLLKPYDRDCRQTERQKALIGGHYLLGADQT